MKSLISFLQKHQSTIEIICLALLSAYFLYQSGFFLSHIANNIGPDGGFHVQQILFSYLSPWLSFHIPEDTPMHAHFASIAAHNYFYHYFIGKLLHIIPFGENPLSEIRYLSLIFNCASLFFFYKTSRLFLDNPWQRILAFAIQTNLLMFTFMGTIIHYDTFANGIALASFYFFFLYLKKQKLSAILWSFSLIMISCLSKSTNLPLIPLMGLCWIYANRSEIKNIPHKKYLSKIGKNLINKKVILLITITITTIFSITYVGNWISYGSPAPTCSQIFSYEKCAKESPYIKYDLTKKESFKTQKNEASNIKEQDPFRLFTFWANTITDRTLGIYLNTSRNAIPSTVATFLVKLFLLLAGIQTIRHLNLSSKIESSSIFISISYILFFFLYFIFYGGYIKTGGVVNTMYEGRYIFVVIPLTIIIFSKYFLTLFSKKYIPWAVTIVAAIFIYSGLPSYLTNCHRKTIEPNIQNVEPFKSCTKKMPMPGLFLPI